jgi:sugar phosphate isomerase/epimerase
MQGRPSSLDLVEYCHSLGLVGAEVMAPPADTAGIQALRQKVEQYRMQIIMNPRLPRSAGEVTQFDAAVAACKECGATALHAAMTGRRYEEFNSLDDFKKSFEKNQQTIALAEPVLRKHQIKLAIENHKGWRSDEQAAWLKRIGSEWVGACLDFGNNIALCETPSKTLTNLAPYTIFTHIKDMGLQSYEDGFLLSEVPFGQGVIDLKETIETLRKTDPNMLFCLEMITRDPLRVPVFTDKYWATFNDPPELIPGSDLAKVLKLVKDHGSKAPLPHVTGLNREERAQLEERYNRECIDYSRQQLNMV